jgi:hypothetical protein
MATSRKSDLFAAFEIDVTAKSIYKASIFEKPERRGRNNSKDVKSMVSWNIALSQNVVWSSAIIHILTMYNDPRVLLKSNTVI